MPSSRSGSPTSPSSRGGPERPGPGGRVPAGWRAWLAGARPRTLPAAISPVLVGTAAAAAEGAFVAWRAAAALVVSLALQVGVNYANDYSDGIRGADPPDRLGPARLVASGAARPRQVLAAAAIAFAVAAIAGLALAVAVDLRLLLVGAACILAAVLYTGGPVPYGYKGFGELAVLVFFGVVATCGSAYVQLARVPATAAVASVVVGLASVAILLANNIRDIDSDAAAGKRTLVVRLGRERSRWLYTATIAGIFVTVAALGVSRPPVLLALLAAPLAVEPVRLVHRREDGPGLVAALVATARLQLALGILLAAGLWVS